MSIDLDTIDKAISEVARTCTGLRTALRSVDLDDEVEATYQLETDVMDKLEALRAMAADTAPSGDCPPAEPLTVTDPPASASSTT